MRYLRAHGFAHQDIVSANNGSIRSGSTRPSRHGRGRLEQWRSANGLADRTVLLSCARLDPKNRFEQVLTALPAIVRQVPDVLWCLIGTGPEADALAARVTEAGLGPHVRFVGELYDKMDLAPWFLSAEVFVHPGAIGLSLVHAFGYGVPVITHGNAEHQGPEFAAFEEGRSGRTYRENHTAGLADAVIGLLADASLRSQMGQHVQRVARTQYNVDVMVERFVATAKRAAQARARGLAG